MARDSACCWCKQTMISLNTITNITCVREIPLTHYYYYYYISLISQETERQQTDKTDTTKRQTNRQKGVKRTYFRICSRRICRRLCCGLTRQASFKLSSFFFLRISLNSDCNFSYSSSHAWKISAQLHITWSHQRNQQQQVVYLFLKWTLQGASEQ